ncbi:MAG: hypothetical protein H0U74_12545 [Bradymonadaceae bacterium]|nr:hypothetical protein [Lujinxingiaceae bacterium]
MTTINTSSPGASIRVMKAPAGKGGEIRAIFAPGNVRIVKREVIDHVQAVQQRLAHACAEAAQIVEQANAEAEGVLEAAREEGRRQGRLELLVELGRARSEYDKLMSKAEADMIELAFRIARQVIGHNVATEPAVLGGIVARSLEFVRGKRQIVILVNPDDLSALEASRHELATMIEGAALYFSADANIERGGCIIETESGRLDARLDVQLDILRKALTRGGPR